MIYFHEYIHALCYPRSSVKQIWKNKKDNAYFVYCDAIVSKKRWIVICIMPTLMIVVLPFLIWILVAKYLPINIMVCTFILLLIMMLGSSGDFINIYNTLRQVPKGGKVFNYWDLHSYWIK